MTINVMQDIILILFIASSFWLIYRERDLRLGIIVNEDNWKHTNGKQGIVTTIGRSSSNDVKLKEHSVSRLQAVISYNAKTQKYDMTEYGKVGSCTNGYHIANHSLQFNLPREERCFEFGFIPTVLALLFIFLQGISTYIELQNIQAIIPHLILIFFIVITWGIRADKQPITEGVFAVFLTYYIDATLYGLSNDESIQKGITSAILGITFYTVLSLAIRGFLHFDMDKHNLHINLRVLAIVGIISLIIINLVMATEINGAYNWITLGSITFQPSEIVKLLLSFVLIVPTAKHFNSIDNLIITLGVSAICFAYGLLIKDIGALLQFGIIFVVAVLLQNSNILYSILMIVAGVAGCKGILYISSTASSRIEGWLGKNNSIFESLTASGIFDNPYDYGYQSIHSLVAAFKNGGLFGNSEFDVLSGIEAANSDLVTSMIAQKHGSIVLYLILGLYLVLIANTIFTLRQKSKFQQIFSCIGITLIVFAMSLNLCGTFGIVALTGVVSPALSDGISAAISYGCIFGVISSSAMSKEYLTTIRKGELNNG